MIKCKKLFASLLSVFTLATQLSPVLSVHTEDENLFITEAHAEETYTVTYDAGNGQFDGGNKTNTVTYTGKYERPTAPEGKKLDGRTTTQNGAVAYPKTGIPYTEKITSNMTLYAVYSDWIEDWEYTLDEVNHTILLKKYNGDETVYEIPAKTTIQNTDYVTMIGKNSNAWMATQFDTGVILNLSFQNGVQTNSSFENLFYGNKTIQSIDFNGVDTSKVTSMASMFEGCSSLTSLDVSNFDTSNVSNMSNMFNGCESLESLDLSNFDTSKLTNMYYMFNRCSNLRSLDLSNFNTSKVTDMANMFAYCSKLTSLDVSHFDTSKVIDMKQMFAYCSKLTSLDVSHFDTSKVINMKQMFYGCSSLTSLDVFANQNTFTAIKGSSSTNDGYTAVSNKLSRIRLHKGNGNGDASKLCAFVQQNKNNTVDGYTGNWTAFSEYNYANGSELTPDINSKYSSLQNAYNSITDKQWAENPDGIWFVWEKEKTYTYNVKYVSSTGKSLGTATATGTFGTTAKVSAPSKTGYTTPAVQDVAFDSVNAKTITFTYVPVSYSIGYNLNGGSVTGNPTSYTIESEEITLKNPGKTGYSFAGWTGSNGSTPQTDVKITTGSTGDKTYTANWTPITTTVTFDPQGGTNHLGSGTNILGLTYDHSSFYVRLLPTLTGYTFDGYYTGKKGTGVKVYGTGVDPDVHPDDNTVYMLANPEDGYWKLAGTTCCIWQNTASALTLYANWTANTYTVKFDANGGAGNPVTQKMTYDKDATLTPVSYTRAKHSFLYWTENADGSGKKYTDKASVKNLTTNGTVTLYAQWEKLTDLKIMNTVSGNMGNRAKNFEFSTAFPACFQNRAFTVIKGDGTKETVTIGADGVMKFSLKHGETFTITNLDTEQVNAIKNLGNRDIIESDYTAEGYRTTYAASTEDDGTLVITYSNAKNSGVPTGNHIGTGIVAAVIIGLFGLFFMFRKKFN